MALIVLFQLLGIYLAVSALESVRSIEWAMVPSTLLFVLFGEWASHRYSMHRRVFPRAIYHRHVVEHHAFFASSSMAIDRLDDLYWVLFPPWALPLLVVSVLPLFAAVYLLASANSAWLFLLVVLVYYSVYEIVHALTHVKPGQGAMGIAHSALAAHHRAHHDPELSSRWNFNFVVPLFDWLFGTRWRG